MKNQEKLQFKFSNSKGFRVIVYRKGKRIGRIIQKFDHYQFVPSGSQWGGDIFANLQDLRRSLVAST